MRVCNNKIDVNLMLNLSTFIALNVQELSTNSRLVAGSKLITGVGKKRPSR
jgi:hypothetical protein